MWCVCVCLWLSFGGFGCFREDTGVDVFSLDMCQSNTFIMEWRDICIIFIC